MVVVVAMVMVRAVVRSLILKMCVGGGVGGSLPMANMAVAMVPRVRRPNRRRLLLILRSVPCGHRRRKAGRGRGRGRGSAVEWMNELLVLLT